MSSAGPSPTPSPAPYSPNGYTPNGNQSNGNGNGATTPAGGVSPHVVRKKLMGYVGFANLPNQVHRKSVRKGFQFTVMVVGMSCHSSCFTIDGALDFYLLRVFLPFSGEGGLGKSTLINTLFNTTLYPGKQPLEPSDNRPSTVAIESISAG